MVLDYGSGGEVQNQDFFRQGYVGYSCNLFFRLRYFGENWGFLDYRCKLGLFQVYQEVWLFWVESFFLLWLYYYSKVVFVFKLVWELFLYFFFVGLFFERGLGFNFVEQFFQKNRRVGVGQVVVWEVWWIVNLQVLVLVVKIGFYELIGWEVVICLWRFRVLVFSLLLGQLLFWVVFVFVLS